MRGRSGWASCLAAALVVAGASLAAQDELRTRLSLSYNGAPATQVLEAVSKVLGFRLQIDPKVGGPVTLDLRNVTVDTALRVICDEVGCRWRIDKKVLIVEPDPGSPPPAPAGPLSSLKVDDVHDDVPVQVLWTDAPLDAVATTFARMLSADLVIDEALRANRISLSQNKDTLWVALNAVCRQAGCRWRLVTAPRRVLMLVGAEPHVTRAELPRGIPRVGEPGVVAPRLVSAMRPAYPPAARQSNAQGTVDMECVVRLDGTVGDVRVVRSMTDVRPERAPNFDKAGDLEREAAIAARLYLFEPGTKNGQPSAIIVPLSLAFTIR